MEQVSKLLNLNDSRMSLNILSFANWFGLLFRINCNIVFYYKLQLHTDFIQSLEFPKILT